MERIVEHTINGRMYGVRLFNPFEAYRICSRWLTPSRDAKEEASIGMEALRRCIAPDGRRMSSAEDIDEHFSEYPGDMLPLAIAARKILVREFSEGMERYFKERDALLRRHSRKQPKTKVPPGWEIYSFFGRLTSAGLCSFTDLLNGSFTFADVLEMQRIADWDVYCSYEAAERAKAGGPQKRR